MNKDLISICLEEVIFDQENKDLVQEGVVSKIGGKIVTKAMNSPKLLKYFTNDKVTGAVAAAAAGGAVGGSIGIVNANKNLKNKINPLVSTDSKEKSNLPSTAIKVGYGAAAAGGAYLLYKGIKALYTKYKEAKTPETKEFIKKQINSKKAQLKKVKSKK